MIDVKKKDIIAVKWLTTNVHSVSNAIINFSYVFTLPSELFFFFTKSIIFLTIVV